MTFKEYVDTLNTILYERPGLGNLDVVYATDAEGNGYERVHYTPTLGFFDHGDFIPDSSFEEFQENYDEELIANAICIN
jgi:hypothetical protein